MSQHINYSHMCVIIVIKNQRICSPTSLEHQKKSCSNRRPGPRSAHVRDIMLLKSRDNSHIISLHEQTHEAHQKKAVKLLETDIGGRGYPGPIILYKNNSLS